MPRYKLYIEYNGTNYSGWQIQPDANTVEQELEKALSRILQEEIDIIGQGRTDSGVHAEAQVAHFDTDQSIDTGKLLYALLGVLPRDIAVWDLQQAPDDFHARFDGKSRQYRYQIVTRPSPLFYRTAAFVPQELNWDTMQRCARMIKGTHDFEGFSKSNKDQSDAVCTVDLSELHKSEHLITYRIRANRFVRHMVRRLIGSMLRVGQGKWPERHFGDLLHHPEKQNNGHGAAAKGLILEKVEY